MGEDLAGFVAAILANPENDTTRLVMADWFDEQEHDSQAALLRAPGQWIIDPHPWTLGWRVGDRATRAIVWVGRVDYRKRPYCHYRDANHVFCDDVRGNYEGRDKLRYVGGAWVCRSCCCTTGAGR